MAIILRIGAGHMGRQTMAVIARKWKCRVLQKRAVHWLGQKHWADIERQAGRTL